MNISMPHLITEQMSGSIHLCHHGSIGMAKIMILEINMKLALDFSCRIFGDYEKKSVKVIM